MLSAAGYDRHVEQLLDVVKRLAEALSGAGIDYRIVGGVAVFLHVRERDPLAARMTRDIDVAIHRRDLGAIAEVAPAYGSEYRHAAGVDMLVDRLAPETRSAVHFVFAGEKERPEYAEPVPPFSEAVRSAEGLLLAPVADLVRMKVTSFRLRDQVHLKDMDTIGLITPEIEASLPELLLAGLHHLRTLS